jgi:Ala-tRNA(Pro) deacylase
VLNADGRFVIAVVPASNCVDLNQARNVLGARSVKLALEQELADRFPDCEVGAVPPFGSEYGLETLVEEDLTHDRLIAFEGNSHDEAICMSYEDLDQIEHPQVAHFSRPRHPLN